MSPRADTGVCCQQLKEGTASCTHARAHGQRGVLVARFPQAPWGLGKLSARACAQGASCEENAALIEAVNQTGRAFLSHSELGGVYMLRFAVSGAQTQVGYTVQG